MDFYQQNTIQNMSSMFSMRNDDDQYRFVSSCRSTYMTRTISSARSFLAGLFSSNQTDNQIQANGKIRMGNLPDFSMCFSFSRKGPFEIEVHHFPDEDMVNISSFKIVLHIESFFSFLIL